MKILNLNSWNNAVGADRLEMVFENRFKEYGAFQIRRNGNRNTIIAMLVAAFVCMALFASFTLGKNQVIGEPNETVQSRPGSPADNPIPEMEEKPETANSGATSNSGVPDIDPLLPDFRLPTPGLPGNTNGNANGLPGMGTDSIHKPNPFTAMNKPVEIIEKPDRQAVYLGGEDAFVEFIRENFITPPRCLDEMAVGYAKIRFVVSTDGRLSGFKVLEVSPSCPEFADEAIRILKGSKRWIPAIQNGKFVNAWRESEIRLRY